ncbi:condensation domain-containing protein [Streptomyces sp. NPDC006602]|uniref:condensation domain-containing protein n=1 Tax=Streptomyces sp. NPDC006602 TaxID=3364751 RepID=UPI0036BD56B7
MATVLPAGLAGESTQRAGLSAGQQQMWFLQQYDPDSPAYLMTWVLRVHGELDTEALRTSWEQVVKRHEILRTRYVQSGSHPQRLVDPPRRFELRTVDLADRPADGLHERALRTAQSERRRGFDLAMEHPVRVTHIKADVDHHLVVISIHHIACDATSYLRIAAEVNELYSAYVQGRQPELPDVRTQYADFAAWQEASRADGTLRPHLDYWRGTLSGLRELALPTDRPRPARPDSRCGLVKVSVEPETADRIRALAGAHRSSPSIVLLTAYTALLSHITGSDDVTVGMPVSARTVPALDDVVGYLVNTVALRSRHAEDDTFATLLARVRDCYLDALDHRAAPFTWVVEEASPVRGADAGSLCRVGFDVNQPDVGAFQLAGAQVEHLDLDAVPAAKFDLTLHIEDTSAGPLSATLEFATALIDQETAAEWATGYESLLDAVVLQPGEPLSRVLGSRRQRPEPSAPGAEEAASPTSVGEAPTELIARIKRIWCEVLRLDDADVRANFFDVGGDSLRAVALAGRLKEDALPVSAAGIFANQTIEALAGLLAASGTGSPPPTNTPTPPFSLVSAEDRSALPRGVVDAYPLAMLQLGMIVEMRALPEINPYQDSTSFLIRDGEEVNQAALRQAAQIVVDRHEVLRTTFDLTSYSVPLQLVHEHAAITVGFTHHGELGPAGWRPRLEVFAAEERRALIDMTRAPLIRVHAHTADGTREWWLSITEFHPILEGWSFHGLLMEILDCYQELRAGRRPAEPASVSFRYVDYIAAEGASLRSDENRAYWKQVIEGRTGIVLPSAWRGDRDAPRERYQHTVSIRDLEDDLRALATKTRTSLKAVLLAAHMKVMSTVVGSDSFVSGLVCDARPEVAGAEQVPGMYLNTLPFAMPTKARTWGALVTAVYGALTDLWPHRTFPMRAIQQEFGQGDRLLDVYYNYTDFHQVDQELIDYDQTLNDNENEFALHVFSVAGVLKFNTTSHQLSREAATRLGELYRSVLRSMCQGPDGDAWSSCLPQRERDWLLSMGQGPSPLSEPVPVPEWFAAQVRDRPDAVAPSRSRQFVTYAQLDGWAAEMARQLTGAGVGPQDVVAVQPGCDIGTLAALLAVWRAGAAWTPLDPATPAPQARTLRAGPGVTAVVAPTGAVADGACVLPGGWGAGASGAVVSHTSLAETVESLHRALETAGGGTVRGASWLLSPASTVGWQLGELLVPTTSTGTQAVEGWRTEALPGWATLAGRPTPGRVVRILDSSLRPVPAQVVGELCVGGVGLPDGFHQDPARTVESFVPDPLGTCGERLLRTGHLARFAADGTVEHLGPRETLCGGNRQPIESYRTRELLNTHPAVLDSQVLARPTVAEGRPRLIAYVQAVPGSQAEVAELTRFLAEGLPRHLVPAALVDISDWPLTGDGSLDVDALPDPPTTESESAGAEKPWDDQYEELLQTVLGEVAGNIEVAPHLALADIGLDSLAFVRLLVGLERAYDIVIPDELLMVFDTFWTPKTLWEEIVALRTAAHQQSDNGTEEGRK